MFPKRQLGLIDIEATIVVIIVGLLAGIFLPRWIVQGSVAITRDGALVPAAGFFCFVAAKASLFRRGIWMSWGPGEMSVGWARIYKFAYVLMGIGVVLILMAFRFGR